uniref:Uncharacterized protein n=1 Tax=Chromera velia CCMP2878 TaxID=1169474 RepID=A0A0G4F5V8_9ALVE|eukprot:Cvel_2777.t1-p1 / transcript=Cvel_2777.t1 / gene=Cvel_2777 / organism=Chromera_velia_CCMP2878 / gene_product=hypothetical protein / transcript_product=hypothetical protein / location=Cvel_scaffold111:111291-111797(-) / protein_length=169 / sequence_SO=supercontig / SO=protein_coding / is_pseudo=false
MSAQAVLSTPQQTGRTGADSPTAAAGRKKMQIAGRWDLKPPEFSRDLKAEDQKKENQRALEHFRFSFDIHQESTALVLGYDKATAGPAEQKMWNLQMKQALTQCGMKDAEFFTVVKNALQKPGATYKDGLVVLEKHFGHDAISMLVTAVFALIDFAGNKVRATEETLVV